MGVKETRNHDKNTISLQLQVSVTVLYTLLFWLLDVKCVLCVCADIILFCLLLNLIEDEY
jgi:hypothetical protein